MALLEVAGRRLLQGPLLADGGFAYVHRGLDVASGEAVAIRRALVQETEARARAEEELAILRRLPGHPHVVRCLGVEIFSGAAGGGSELISIMELCSGGTLLSHLERAVAQRGSTTRCCPCLPQAEVLGALAALSAALAHLHGEKVIHYDVKSENLLLGADQRWKLGDFGSASTRCFDLTCARRKEMLEVEDFVHGRCTPMYRPPEIADTYLRWPVFSAVDVFASGCVLFATLTGTHPFPMDSLLGNINVSYSLPAEADAAYSSALLALLRRLLARDPRERPLAADVYSASEALVSGSSPEVLPATNVNPEHHLDCSRHETGEEPVLCESAPPHITDEQAPRAEVFESRVVERAQISDRQDMASPRVASDFSCGDVVLAMYGLAGGRYCWAQITRMYATRDGVQLCDVRWLRPQAGQKPDELYVCVDESDETDCMERLEVLRHVRHPVLSDLSPHSPPSALASAKRAALLHPGSSCPNGDGDGLRAEEIARVSSGLSDVGCSESSSPSGPAMHVAFERSPRAGSCRQFHGPCSDSDGAVAAAAAASDAEQLPEVLDEADVAPAAGLAAEQPPPPEAVHFACTLYVMEVSGAEFAFGAGASWWTVPFRIGVQVNSQVVFVGERLDLLDGVKVVELTAAHDVAVVIVPADQAALPVMASEALQWSEMYADSIPIAQAAEERSWHGWLPLVRTAPGASLSSDLRVRVIAVLDGPVSRADPQQRPDAYGVSWPTFEGVVDERSIDAPRMPLLVGCGKDRPAARGHAKRAELCF